jgi:hypothetical protein
MKCASFAIGLPPCESNALRLYTIKQMRGAVGARSVP